jgi:hypothetical protein
MTTDRAHCLPPRYASNVARHEKKENIDIFAK